jgi:hypothetical protein
VKEQVNDVQEEPSGGEGVCKLTERNRAFLLVVRMTYRRRMWAPYVIFWNLSPMFELRVKRAHGKKMSRKKMMSTMILARA